eukprot:scaffold35206_cov34-Prasinocladus_malaysianus.AAC.1
MRMRMVDVRALGSQPSSQVILSITMAALTSYTNLRHLVSSAGLCRAGLCHVQQSMAADRERALGQRADECEALRAQVEDLEAQLRESRGQLGQTDKARAEAEDAAKVSRALSPRYLHTPRTHIHVYSCWDCQDAICLQWPIIATLKTLKPYKPESNSTNQILACDQEELRALQKELEASRAAASQAIQTNLPLPEKILPRI